MNLILQLYVGLTIILAALLFAVIALIIIYFRLLRKYADTERSKLEKEDALEKETEAVLKRAENEYSQRLKTAEEKAKTIIQKATAEKTSTEEALLKALEELDKDQQNIISQGLNNLFAKHKLSDEKTLLNLQTNTSKDIVKHPEIAVNNYKITLKEAAKSEQQTIEKHFDEEYQILEEELSNYKRTRLEAIDKNIVELVREVSEETLGNALDIKDHQKLILEALANAKKKGNL
jgi:F0F1-type ATP synthase membrane subunit b/b'